MQLPENKALFCFLDVETTGENKYRDEIWSCSYQIDFIEIENKNGWNVLSHAPNTYLQTYIVAHQPLASPWVINNTEYLNHFLHNGNSKNVDETLCKVDFIQTFLAYLEKQKQLNNCKMYLVGANPAFDNCFLERLKNEYFPEEEMPWDFHLIDIEQMAYAKSCKTILKPPSLAKCLELTTGRKLEKHYIHDSKEDVKNTREVFYKILLGDNNELV